MMTASGQAHHLLEDHTDETCNASKTCMHRRPLLMGNRQHMHVASEAMDFLQSTGSELPGSHVRSPTAEGP